MSKYTTRFKLKIVRQFLAGPLGGRRLARQHGLPYSMVYRWTQRFQLHGEAGLMPMAASTRYDATFRLKVLRHMWRKELSYAQAAARFGVSGSSTIARWERQYHVRDAGASSRSHSPRYDDDHSRQATHAPRSGSPCRHPDEGRTAQRKPAAARRVGAAQVFQRLRALEKKSAEEKARAIEALRPHYPLDDLLQAARLSRSTFYYRKALWDAPDPRADIKTAVCNITTEHRWYGYRRVTLQLHRQGHRINHKRVQRLMQDLGLQVRRKAQKYRSYRGQGHKEITNQLQRDFTATEPNTRWVTDVTEFTVGGEKCYLSPIMDLYNREIIAFQIARRPTLALVQGMLRKGLRRLPPGATPLIHSDQGWHYQHAAYRQALTQNSLKQSMSAKGNCYDNAAMESFFGILKNEMFYGSHFDSIDHLQAAIRRYIRYYNHKRLKAKLNGLSPVEYRIRAAAT